MVPSQSREALEAYNSVHCVHPHYSALHVTNKSQLNRRTGNTPGIPHKSFVRHRRDLSMGILSTLTRSSYPEPIHKSLSPPKPALTDGVSVPPCPLKTSLQSNAGTEDENALVEAKGNCISLYATQPRTFQVKLPQTSAPSVAPYKLQEAQISMNPSPRNCYTNENRTHSSLAVENGLTQPSVAHGQIPNEDTGTGNNHSSTPPRHILPPPVTTPSVRRTHSINSVTGVPRENTHFKISQLKTTVTNGTSSVLPKGSIDNENIHVRQTQVLIFKDENDLFRGKRRRLSPPSSQTSTITNSHPLRFNTISDTVPPLKLRKAVSQCDSALDNEETTRTVSMSRNISESLKSKPGAERERQRMIVKKSDFIPTGMRLRPRPRFSRCGVRHGPLRSSRRQLNWIRPFPNQVGGGGTLSKMQSQPHTQDEVVASNEPNNQKEEDCMSIEANSPEKSHSKPIAKSSSSSSPERTPKAVRRRRRSKRLEGKLQMNEVIEIDDSDDEERRVSDAGARTRETDECDLARCALATLSLGSEKKRLKDLAPCPFLSPLSDEEEAEVLKLHRQRSEKEIKFIPSANIVLRGEDFKRLRGVRWLNDEVINAYMSLINMRNDSIFTELTEEERKHIPRTYVFNTFFYTRLTSGPEQYDYTGVRRWTRRDKLDVMKQDLLLFPVNLGNHHWVLAGIDRERRTFLYLDSMGGPDKSRALESLRKWYYDELKDKHGEDVAKQEDLETWPCAHNRYMIRRVGVLPEELEPRECKPRLARIPAQSDGGSCGVFITKIADCLSLGIKIYFKQVSIPLIRRRMTLDLLRGQLLM